MQTAYMDHAAATPVKGAVIAVMAPYFDRHFGNPSAVYDLGTRCKQVMDAQRARVAGLIGARPDEIIFTSSGARPTIWPSKAPPWPGQKKDGTSLFRPSSTTRCSIRPDF